MQVLIHNSVPTTGGLTSDQQVYFRGLLQNYPHWGSHFYDLYILSILYNIHNWCLI